MAAPAAAVSSSSAPAIAARDYYLLIDKSGTMSKKDDGKTSRFQAVQESVYALAAKIITLDPDGVNVYLFSGRFKRYLNITDAEKVNNIFMESEPFGGTVLAPVLKDALTDYFTSKGTAKHKANGATILVVTDGEADDKTEVIAEIQRAAMSITNPKELAISFIQVGNEGAAKGFLEYLDRELPKVTGGRDIVHTIKLEDIEDRGLTQVLYDAVFQGQQ